MPKALSEAEVCKAPYEASTTFFVGVGVGVSLVVLANYFLRDKKRLAPASADEEPAATHAAAHVTPATSWPAGKPVFTEMKDYPAWDDKDKTASFMKINDLLVAEVGENRLVHTSALSPSNLTLKVLEELPRLYELPAREVEWVHRMLNYNVKGGKMNRGLMVVESVKELAKVIYLIIYHEIYTHDVAQHCDSFMGRCLAHRKYRASLFWDGRLSGCRRVLPRASRSPLFIKIYSQRPGCSWPMISWMTAKLGAGSPVGKPYFVKVYNSLIGPVIRYLVDDVKKIAINDAYFVEACLP